MRQEQRLTPQLIQSMNILQLNVAALEARIQEELETNPILEYEPEAVPETPTAETNDPEGNASDDGAKLEVLEWLSEEYDSDRIQRSRSTSGDGDRDAKLDAMANTASKPCTLYEYMLNQWALVEVDDDVRRAGEALINHLDDDGLLRIALEQVAETIHPAVSDAVFEDALSRVQALEPAGIGATTLQQCLLLQIKALPGDNSLEEQLVRDHFDDILKNRMPRVSKAVGCDIEELKEAMLVLGRLTPTPGLSVADRTIPRLKPDVIVEYADDGGGYNVRLANGNEPRLRISKRYLSMLKDRSQEKEARTYLKKQHESAAALIDAIVFRRSRLLEVAESVVAHQQDFFDQGPQHLRVLRMSDLAGQLGCDPSTISRTVADKYMQSPRGIFPLRDFFVGGTESDSGESTSWDSVKSRVKELIDEEDKKSPMSDDLVAKVMKKEGIDISRRTVAKYRQQLNIPTARQRKTF